MHVLPLSVYVLDLESDGPARVEQALTLTDLERLCEQATPGPWQARFIFRAFQAARKQDDLLVLPRPEADWPDSEFIAAAREWLPKLIAVARVAEAWRQQRFEGNTAPGAEDRVWILRLGEAEEALAKALGVWNEPPRYNPDFPRALNSGCFAEPGKESGTP